VQAPNKKGGVASRPRRPILLDIRLNGTVVRAVEPMAGLTAAGRERAGATSS